MPGEEEYADDLGDIKILTQHVETLGTQRYYSTDLGNDASVFTDIYVSSQPLSFVRGIKRTPIVGNSVILFCHSKGCLSPLGLVVWIGEGVQILSHMMGDILFGLI